MGTKFLASLQNVIPNPKPRSTKWCSTSVPMDNWSDPLARYSSAEYHVNNFLSPVLFEETSALIQDDAIVIEIAPHGLFQGILRQSLGPRSAIIALAQIGNEDSIKFLLQSLGTLYNSGINFQLGRW